MKSVSYVKKSLIALVPGFQVRFCRWPDCLSSSVNAIAASNGWLVPTFSSGTAVAGHWCTLCIPDDSNVVHVVDLAVADLCCWSTCCCCWWCCSLWRCRPPMTIVAALWNHPPPLRYIWRSLCPKPGSWIATKLSSIPALWRHSCDTGCDADDDGDVAVADVGLSQLK